MSIEKDRLRLFVKVYVFRKEDIFFNDQRLKSNYFSFFHQSVTTKIKNFRSENYRVLITTKEINALDIDFFEK